MRVEKPDVVLVHSSNDRYGSDRVLLQVVETLADRSIEIWLPDDLGDDGPLSSTLRARGHAVRVLPLPILRRAYLTPRNLPALLARWFRAWGLIRKTRPAVVYLSTSACLPLAPVARILGASVILHLQERWDGVTRGILGFFGVFVQHAIAISEWVNHQAPRRLRRRTRVIRNGVPDLSAPLASASAEDVRVLVASRWNAWKGHGTLLRAWDQAGLRGTLVIAGGPPPSGQSWDVIGAVNRLENPESVVIVGEQGDITRLIDDANVIVVPSDLPEPFGLIAIEAFRRGRPVIASRDGGLGDIVTDGLTGYLFENRSVSELAHILAMLDTRRLKVLGANARDEFERSYSDTRFESEFLKLWAEVLGATK